MTVPPHRPWAASSSFRCVFLLGFYRFARCALTGARRSEAANPGWIGLAGHAGRRYPSPIGVTRLSNDGNLRDGRDGGAMTRVSPMAGGWPESAGSSASVLPADPPVPPGVDPNIPSPSRLYDYYLGGCNNYPVDRALAERLRRFIPEMKDAAWANRGFHQRAVRWLAEKQGIRQFIDIGSGLPTQGNTHEVVRSGSGARVVYVDNDPMVIAHARDLLKADPNTAIIMADLRDPESVLEHSAVAELIDFGEPLALVMTAVLHFVSNGSNPYGLVRRYVETMASGSYVVIAHGTSDNKPPRATGAVVDEYQRATEQIHLRRRHEIERFFKGLELVPPYPGAGARVVFVGEWGAEDPELADSEGSRWSYCGVARCP
jgi:S-adenosyl methyltransferase